MLRDSVIWFVVLLTASLLQLAVGSPSDRGEIVSTADGRIRAVRRRNDADFVLGGLFPVHDNDEDGSRCGEVRKERGVERMEAMLYAIDRINSDPTLLPYITLGFDIRDTCSSENVGLDESIDLVIEDSELDASSCNQDLTSSGNGSAAAIPTSFVIGAAASAVSVPVATLLRLFQLPQVSYSSSSARLNNRERYTYFFRTVPADDLQARAMIDLALRFNWMYVSTIYANDFYGEPGIDEFRKLANQNGICRDLDEGIDSNFVAADYNHLASKLLNSSANVVILFGSQGIAEQLFTALRNVSQTQGIVRRFLWIASDAWARSTSVVSQFSESLVGLFGIAPLTIVDNGFHSYFSQLTLNSNKRNPWFKEFYQAVFNCAINETCNQSQPITDHNGYHQGNFIPLVIDAVYSVAHALNNFLNENCDQPVQWHRNNRTCSGQKRKLDGAALLEYIHRVNFTSPTGNLINFDSNGNVEGRYEIFNYQKVIAGGQENFKFVAVGQWEGMATNRLDLRNMKDLQFGLSTDGPILSARQSRCSVCGPGKVSRTVEGSCCGTCDRCLAKRFSNESNNNICYECAEYEWGNNPLSGSSACVTLEESYLRYENPWSIVLIISAIIGLIGVAFVSFVLGIFWNTAIVKSSGREQMIILLFGISLCFLLTFLFVSKPSTGVCVFQRAGLWLSFSVILGALLIKLVRITRIFLRGQVSTRPKFTGPGWQVLFTILVIAGQFVLVIIALGVVYPVPTREVVLNPDNSMDTPTLILTCIPPQSAAYITLVIILVLYDTILIIACNALAILTIRFPANFNESKYIAFSTFALGLIWLVFIPTYFSTDNELRTAVISSALNLSAFAVLLCIFGPRLFIVIFLPNLNTVENSTHNKKQTVLSTEWNNNNCQNSVYTTECQSKRPIVVCSANYILQVFGTCMFILYCSFKLVCM